MAGNEVGQGRQARVLVGLTATTMTPVGEVRVGAAWQKVSTARRRPTRQGRDGEGLASRVSRPVLAKRADPRNNGYSYALSSAEAAQGRRSARASPPARNARGVGDGRLEGVNGG